MFNSPNTPRKRNNVQHRSLNNKTVQEHNNNTSNQLLKQQKARAFVSWYKHMIDDERQNLVLYLSDEATLEWFGKTIKTHKKVSAFLKYDMQHSKHDFTSVINIDKIESRSERPQRKVDTVLAAPLDSPEQNTKKGTLNRKRTHSSCHSPEWAVGKPLDEDGIERKKIRKDSENDEEKRQSILKFVDDSEISNKGDGVLCGEQMHKTATVTPPKCELGQGDCLPSTSGTDSNKSHEALNAQLLKLAVECNGYVEFIRTKNSYSTDGMKWQRKCKVQISYSEDPLNNGEYIIWTLRYTDESKCRRNLLPAFEEVAREKELKENL